MAIEVADDGAEVEAKARKMGWLPADEFKGNPDKWRPADEYVERGEQFLPIVKAENAKLKRDADTARTEIAELKRVMAESQAAIEELKKFHTEDTARQVAKAKKDLKAGIKQAKAAGDDDLEEDLRQELTELTAAERAAPPVAAVPKPPEPRFDPDYIEWVKDNAWFVPGPNFDHNKQALTMAAAQRLRSDPANNTLVGKDFYDRCAYEAETILNGRPNSRQGKTEASRPRPQGGGEAPPSRRLFSDLPQEAREACDKLDKKLVGDGKAFKNQADWRKHYVDQYFAGEKA